MNLLILFIIKPITFLVSIFYDTSFIYKDDVGFISQELAIIIGKECSGIKFFTTLFLMLLFSFIPKIEGIKKKTASFFCFLIVTYIVTILANTSRIIGSIWILQLNLFSNEKQIRLMHQSIGVTFYFTYLVLVFIIVSKYFRILRGRNESII